MTHKKAVALVIWNPGREKLLGVKRPEDDDDHPGMWGFPATSLDGGESWKDAVRRAAEEKLGVEVEQMEKLSEGTQEREEFTITLRNYEVEIDGEPEVPQPYSGTQYLEWKWMEPEDFRETAETGSLCTSLMLDLQNVEYEMPGNIRKDSISHHTAKTVSPLRLPEHQEHFTKKPVGKKVQPVIRVKTPSTCSRTLEFPVSKLEN